MDLEMLFHIHKYGDAWQLELARTRQARDFQRAMEKASEYPGSRPDDHTLMSPEALKAYQKAFGKPNGSI